MAKKNTFSALDNLRELIYNVQQQIVASGVLTSEEISMFGLDDK